MRREDFLYKGSDFEYSFGTFVGKKIIEVLGFPSELSNGSPVFEINAIVFDDGTKVFVTGDDNIPYVSDDKLKNMDEETLNHLMAQGFKEEEEE